MGHDRTRTAFRRWHVSELAWKNLGVEDLDSVYVLGRVS